MKYAILFSVVLALAAPAFGAGTYILLDEDWEGDGYWPYTNPPGDWDCWGSSPADANDFHGASGSYCPDGYAALVYWSPSEADMNDGLYHYMDFSSITLVPSEGDKLYLEFDHILDWYGTGYSGYAEFYIWDGDHQVLEHWDHGDNQTGSVYVDLANYAGTSYNYLCWWMNITHSWGMDGWGVDNIVVTHEDFDPVNIKSASLGEIKALYRDH